MYGINDVCLSVPTIVGREGAKKVLEVNLSDEELMKLQKSAATLKEYISKLN